MSAQPAPATLHTEPGPHAPSQSIPGQSIPGQSAPGQPAADAHYYRHVLHDLIDMGAGFARLLHQQATAQARATPQDPGPQPAPAPDSLTSIAAAFDRTARAVRRGIALARSLADPIPPASDPAQHRAAVRKRILREVEDTIQRTAPSSGHAASGHAGSCGSSADVADADDDSAEALTVELHDRLDAPDLDADISHRPVADIITEICRDLGLAALPGTHPWHRRTPKDLEQLCARAAAPSRVRQPGAGPLVPIIPQPITPQPVATNPVPPGPAAISSAAGPACAGSAPPDDLAGTPAGIATAPRHPMHLPGQWRPPPEHPLGGPHR